MPGPFPGMDPYLEDPAEWPGVHQRLITYTADTLTAVLPPGYAALMGERLLVLPFERSIYPDVSVEEGTPPGPVGTERRGTAVAEASDPPCILPLPLVERREVYVDIVRGRGRGDVVTTIEILSPANKAVHGGRELYLEKQREVLDSVTHLIEIDLLRAGEYTVAAPEPWTRGLGRWQYLVSLRRSGPTAQFEVWPVSVRKPLPRFRVPLAGEDPDVILDLQVLFDQCYDRGGYRRRIDYGVGAVPALEADDAKWARARLRKQGLTQ